MDDDLDFAGYFYAVKRHWIWALIGFIIVFGGVVAYTYVSEPIYETKSLIAVTNQDQAIFLLGNSAPKTSGLETQKIIIQSPQIMYPIYEKYAENTFELFVDSIPNSNIIEISVRTNSPDRGVDIVDDITNNYIDYTTKTITADAQNNIEFISQKMKLYDEELNLLDMRLNLYDPTITLDREDQLKYQSIQREIVAKNKIYDYLLTKREEAAIAANIDNANIKIIQYPEIPIEPVKPNKPLNFLVGFFLGIAGAIGLAVVRMSIDPVKHRHR